MKELPLDRESRQYIHVTLHNIIKSYDPLTGEEKETVMPYPMERCSEKLMKSEYEKKFFKNRMQKSHYYCAQDENIFLQGTKENALYQKEHAYIIYDVKRCSEKTRVIGDPECA